MKRSYDKELIDKGEYNKDEYLDCLKQLGNVGKFLGGDRATNIAFKHLNYIPTSILDIGCGGGHTAKKLSKMFPSCNIVGIDMNKMAVDYAKEHYKNLVFHHIDEKGIPTTKTIGHFDVVTTTLVFHHMNDDEIINFIKNFKNIGDVLIINDLHRNIIAYFFYAIIAPLFFRNRLITNDGLLSIKRGFSKAELVDYLCKAGISKHKYKIKWFFPFRYVLTIKAV